MLTKVVETACGPVEYSEAGTGEPILYFHGTGLTGEVMLAIESSIIDDGFRLIIPNRPGYGRTPLSPRRSAVDCADAAAGLLDSLGIADVGVMGSSGGAAFAASFAINHPSRVKSLVLLCPQLHRWDHKRWLPRTSRWTLPFLKHDILRALLLKSYRIWLRRMTVARFLETEAGDRYPDVAGDPTSQALAAMTLAAMGRGAKYAGFENDLVIFSTEDVIGDTCSLGMPTLVLHDAADPMAPVDHVDWFASRFPECERVSVRAGGHLIWIGPGADVMHGTRVRFLREHAKRATPPCAASDGGHTSSR